MVCIFSRAGHATVGLTNILVLENENGGDCLAIAEEVVGSLPKKASDGAGMTPARIS